MNLRNTVGRLLACLLLLVGAALTLAPTPGNLTIAEYPGGSEKEGREGSSDVFAIDHELLQPIDAATGLPTGVRQHRALTVLKTIDKATPGFHKALCTGQNLREAVLDFYRLDPATRQEMKYYTITLRNVRIVGMKTMMPTSFLPENETYRHMEEVRLVYEEIEWKWIPDNIVEMDKWRMPGGATAASQSTAGSPSQPALQRDVSKPSTLMKTIAPPADAATTKQNAATGTKKG